MGGSEERGFLARRHIFWWDNFRRQISRRQSFRRHNFRRQIFSFVENVMPEILTPENVTPGRGSAKSQASRKKKLYATPKMGSKFFGKFFMKSLHFSLGHTYVNTNFLKSFKFVRQVDLHCRKCKNVHNSLLKQIFCKVLSLNKTSGLHSYISNAISKVCTSLA